MLMRRLFFYEGPDVPPFPHLVRSQRSSLAVMLALFPSLSGKLSHRPSADAGDVVVDCSPAAVSSGVKFVEAEYGRRQASAACQHHSLRRTEPSHE
ncbi:hypothetical protein SEVIR_1G245401v4 [Setaria viridis]